MRVFLRKNTRIHTKMGEIHELFILALSLVWFAGATPERPIRSEGSPLVFYCLSSGGVFANSPCFSRQNFCLEDSNILKFKESRSSPFFLSLASRKRCDFENAETPRFEIAPPKNR